MTYRLARATVRLTLLDESDAIHEAEPVTLNPDASGDVVAKLHEWADSLPAKLTET